MAAASCKVQEHFAYEAHERNAAGVEEHKVAEGHVVVVVEGMNKEGEPREPGEVGGGSQLTEVPQQPYLVEAE